MLKFYCVVLSHTTTNRGSKKKDRTFSRPNEDKTVAATNSTISFLFYKGATLLWHALKYTNKDRRREREREKTDTKKRKQQLDSAMIF